MPAVDAAGGNDMANPGSNAEVVTKHDSNELAKISRALYVGGAGDVTVVMAGTGTAITFAGVGAGTWLPIRVKRVNSTGTTATNIVSVW